MKETKRKLMPITFYDRTGIQRSLETLAARGWLLEKCSAAGWIYRRIEPAKIHFSVVYFPAADPFDPHPSEKQQRFQEFCMHTGNIPFLSKPTRKSKWKTSTSLSKRP